jgi:hypothetical protein
VRDEAWQKVDAERHRRNRKLIEDGLERERSLKRFQEEENPEKEENRENDKKCKEEKISVKRVDWAHLEQEGQEQLKRDQPRAMRVGILRFRPNSWTGKTSRAF